jgi:hypothetical protein
MSPKGMHRRLNGEFVPGTESWFSFGYLKTEENSEDKGYIARPTDQRLKFGLLFQDYMPNIPSVKIYLNLVTIQDCQEVLLPADLSKPIK